MRNTRAESTASSTITTVPEREPFTTHEACEAAGLTYRQLDVLDRTHVLEPSLRTATGTGSRRLYTAGDVTALKVVRQLRGLGMRGAIVGRAASLVRDATQASASPTSCRLLLTENRAELVDEARLAHEVEASCGAVILVEVDWTG